MNAAEQIKFKALQTQVAKLDARVNALTITLVSLLSGEITVELLERMKERLIAVSLQTLAPDEHQDAMTDAFDMLIAAQMQGQLMPAPSH